MANVVSIASKPGEGAFAQPQAEKPKPGAAPADGILVTASAVAQIRKAMDKEGFPLAEGGLRLGVKGGGCSGMSYAMSFDKRQRETDRIFEFDGLRVFIDPKSFIYLHGITLDYEQTLMRQGFNFINPNSSKSCGCGSSFSV